MGPIALVPNPEPFFRHQEAFVTFGRQQINRLEDARAGKDAYFQIIPTGTVWYPVQQRFEVTRTSSGFLELSVPRSQGRNRFGRTLRNEPVSNVHVGRKVLQRVDRTLQPGIGLSQSDKLFKYLR